jgi:hypothetical protein
MIAPDGRHGLGMITLLVATFVGCEAPVAQTASSAAPRVAVPAGWVTVSTAGAELQMSLPPWLLVSDNMNAIFANEVPRAGSSEIPIQLMAVPPGIDTDPGPGGDLVAWIDTRLGDAGKGVPVITEVSLPAGSAVRYERLDRTGLPTAWHILALAIRTRSGIAYLLIDGLPDAWPGRREDIERIPFLLRVR